MKRLPTIISLLLIACPVTLADDAVLRDTPQAVTPPTAVQGFIVSVPTGATAMELDLTKKSDRIIMQQFIEKAQTQKSPSILHPIKKMDYWCDNHPNACRKFRTRILPATQFLGVMVGMGFSIAGAL